jgi:hypothetical protein
MESLLKSLSKIVTFSKSSSFALNEKFLTAKAYKDTTNHIILLVYQRTMMLLAIAKNYAISQANIIYYDSLLEITASNPNTLQIQILSVSLRPSRVIFLALKV